MGRITRRNFVTGAAGALSGLVPPGPALGAGPGGPRRQAVPSRAEHRDGEREGERDFRGMWLATVANRDWPSRPGLSAGAQRAELLARLDQAVERRLTAVLFQVRPTADALWPSPYEPWSAWLTGVQGQDPGWDPLGTAVIEAHRRGLELHAWFNPYRVATHADPSRLVPSHPARVHPDWVVTYGGKLHYDPGLPEVRRFVQDAVLDAVHRYDLDGVHFDDYFYPYPVAAQRFDDDAAYARYGTGFPDRDAWRRDNIDLLVRETAERIKEIDGRVRFGISPFGVWRNQAADGRGSATTAGVQAYDDLHADTRRWVREGWLDYLCPQLYWHIGFAAADYAVLVPWWDEVARGTGVDLYLGEALYKAGDPAQPAAWQDPAELSRHLTLARRSPSVRGHCFFAARDVAEDRIGAMARVVADHYQPEAR
ncbi:glycoside hydrolase family 10 protein [Kitasatospora sp. NPDC127059]|uniref:glycoside hydrolase family 10 protein n=1 Tax=unclassified Kitasatospora TaxID=2633591 RepID=UPI0036623FBE